MYRPGRAPRRAAGELEEKRRIIHIFDDILEVFERDQFARLTNRFKESADVDSRFSTDRRWTHLFCRFFEFL